MFGFLIFLLLICCNDGYIQIVFSLIILLLKYLSIISLVLLDKQNIFLQFFSSNCFCTFTLNLVELSFLNLLSERIK